MKKEKVNKDLKKEVFQKVEKLHPHVILLYVSMIGSGVIFLFTIIAFTLSRPESADFLKIQFPKSFIVSSFLMLLSSYTVTKVLPAYDKDDLDELKKWLGLTFFLGMLFAAAQFTGWRELDANNILFTGEASGAYLYVISGLHVLHLAGILVFLGYLLMDCHKTSKDVVKHLMYSTNPYQKIRLKILVKAWHFVDLAWIVLFFYFLFSF